MFHSFGHIHLKVCQNTPCSCVSRVKMFLAFYVGRSVLQAGQLSTHSSSSAMPLSCVRNVVLHCLVEKWKSLKRKDVLSKAACALYVLLCVNDAFSIGLAIMLTCFSKTVKNHICLACICHCQQMSMLLFRLNSNISVSRYNFRRLYRNLTTSSLVTLTMEKS